MISLTESEVAGRNGRGEIAESLLARHYEIFRYRVSRPNGRGRRTVKSYVNEIVSGVDTRRRDEARNDNTRSRRVRY